MFKIFISQPMSGIDIKEIKAKREVAIMHFNDIYGEIEYEIIDNLQEDSPNKTHLQYLGKDIELLDEADLVYFLEGWDKYRGCMVEFTVCREYKIPMVFEESIG